MSISTLDDAATDLGNEALSNLPAQFTAAFKQSNRLLRLHTPLGPNVLLPESLKAMEAISGAPQVNEGDLLVPVSMTGYLLQIDALSTNAHLELKALIGQPVLLELLTDQSRTQLRPFHGHVSAAVCVGSNGGMARYRLTVQPWLAFLGAGRDSAVFQDQNVLQIVQTLFTDYQSSLKGSGQLAPLWRLDVRDADVYPVRSLTTQYHESDLQFMERLLLEEGLFYWFEHAGDAASASFGSHTLVIADHSGAFKPNARASIRFSQSKGVIEDDTIDQWSPQRQWHTHAIELASWDYRSLNQRSVTEHAGNGTAGNSSAGHGTNSPSAFVPTGVPALHSQDTPGAYVYENTAQGQRLAVNQLQATSVPGHSITACGTVRALAPASTFGLTGHASPNAAGAQYAVLRILHHAKNNLSAQLNGHAEKLAKSAPSALDICASSYEINSVLKVARQVNSGSNDSNSVEIFYRNAAQVLPTSVPYRGASLDGHGQLIHPKPRTSGSQTALVIGVAGQHLSTDRDSRVKVQFAWQRGGGSQSRLDHPALDGHSGAPAADGSGGAGTTTGTWVRVATPLAPIAGANWGSVALPRIGQEVLITFLGGDIDRPVITGSLYNGQGQDNAQSNQVGQGAANATGNAPSWFPGSQEASGKQGKLPGHAHTAVLSGIKTQALSASQTGQGGYNQIVFDDTPGQSRLALHSHSSGEAGTGSSGSHSGSHELNLGALRQQTDNQRLGSTGYGFELKTHFSGAIRSGSGMLLTADKRMGNDSGASSHQMDSKEAQSQLQSGQDLIKSLSETAQQHKAMLPVLKTTEVKPDKLPVMVSFAEMGKSLQAMDVRGAAAYLQHSADPNEALEKFDEQIQFLNAHGAKLAKVNYSLEMADGSIVKGLTDAEGKTKRVVTDKPQSITQATLHTSQVASCCAAHAEQSAGKSEGFIVEVKDVETNSQDVGTSVKQVTTARGKSRPMTAGEIDMATNLFGQSVDYSKVKVYNGEFIWFGLQDDDTAMTPNGKMYYPKNLYREDFSNSEEPDMQLLFMHEMVHIWQHQLGYSVIWHGWQRWRLSYEYEFGTDLLLRDFDMEAQGNILSDYWSLKNFGETATLSKSGYRYLTRLDLFEETLAEFLKDPASKTNLPKKRSAGK